MYSFSSRVFRQSGGTLRHFSRISLRQNVAIPCVASSSGSRISSHYSMLFESFGGHDMQHVHTIPLVYDDFHVGNLFFPDSGGYWESCWGSYFKDRKRCLRCRVLLMAVCVFGAWIRCHWRVLLCVAARFLCKCTYAAWAQAGT